MDLFSYIGLYLLAIIWAWHQHIDNNIDKRYIKPAYILYIFVFNFTTLAYGIIVFLIGYILASSLKISKEEWFIMPLMPMFFGPNGFLIITFAHLILWAYNFIRDIKEKPKSKNIMATLLICITYNILSGGLVLW